MLTAVTEPWIHEDRMRPAGVYRLLAKPCDPEVFRDTLRRALGLHPGRPAA